MTEIMYECALEKRAHLYVENGFTERECTACHDDFVPTIEDISTKRPSTFYKTCKRCRDRFARYRKNKEMKDVEKYIASLSITVES